MRPRRGITLIQCVLVISTTGVLVSLAATLLRGLLITESALLDRIAENQSVTDLAGQWRRDLRSATALHVTDQPGQQQTVEITTPSGAVQYRVSPGEVVRQTGTPVIHTVWQFADAPIAVSWEEEPRRGLLTITRRASGNHEAEAHPAAPGLPLTIEGYLPLAVPPENQP